MTRSGNPSVSGWRTKNVRPSLPSRQSGTYHDNLTVDNQAFIADFSTFYEECSHLTFR